MTVVKDKDSIADARNLGRMATALSLENKVLSNGVLPEKTLPERAAVVRGIIDEQLRTGRWADVVELVYNPKSNARLLYDGDMNLLDNEIVESARAYKGDKNPVAALNTLLGANREEMILQLMELSNIPYEQAFVFLNKMENKLDGAQTARASKLVARAASNEGKFREAFVYYLKANDVQGADEVFESCFKEVAEEGTDWSNLGFGSLVEMAKREEGERRTQKLVRIIENEAICKGRAGARFEIYKENNLPLPKETIDRLYDAAAGSMEGWSSYISGDRARSWGKEFDPRLALLWAKKHATTEPQRAYHIFAELEYEGGEVLDAALAGIKKSTFDDSHRALQLTNVNRTHLGMLMGDASVELEVRARIAEHLEDKEKLIAFSREFHATGDNEKAYNCWIGGGGEQDNEFISGIRRRLFEDWMAKERPYIHLHRADVTGHKEAYNLLVQKGDLSEAYDFARYFAMSTGDESMLNEARGKIVADNPVSALRLFEKDESGRALALKAVAQKYGVPEGEAETLFKKFS